MRVVHICEEFLTGGIESLVLDLCRAMQGRQIESRILFLYGQPINAQPNHDWVEITPLRMIRTTRIDPLGLLRLRRTLLRLRPDILHCHGYYAAFAALLIRSIGPRTPIVYTVHANIYRGRQRSGLLIKRVALACDQLAAVSPLSAESVETFTGGTAHPRVVLNGIDLARVSVSDHSVRVQWRRALGVANDSLLLLTVARLNLDQKDHPTLFQSFAEILPSLGNAYLLVVGDGPHRSRLEQLAGDLGLRDRIIFLGERRDVNALLAASDIFVLASHNEGIPISVIEACCAGIPVVATEVGGLLDLRRAGLDLVLTKPRDRSSLREALLSVADPVRRQTLSRQLGERARNILSIERTAEQYLALYQQAKSEARRSLP